MRVLVGWDKPEEAELISLYLNASENHAVITTDRESFLQAASNNGDWDVMLMTITLPDSDAAYDTFRRIRELRPDCPIVGACRTDEIFQIARFLTNGLRTYVPRDLDGDFVFLLNTTLESTVQAVRAEREQMIAERMRDEIESVRRFQESIIPRNLFTPPGYALAGRYEPAQIRVVGGTPVNLAGGDYYDVFALDRKSVVLLMGDAAGHGMRACMSIMTMHTLVKMIATRKYRKTAAFVTEVNRQFCKQSVNAKDGSLITLLYAILRFDRHEITWTSAGHPIPLLHDVTRGAVNPVQTADTAGPPLGVDENYRYASYRTRLPPDSRLLLYTDGLVEAFPEGRQDQLFGVEGVGSTMMRKSAQSGDETLDALFDDSAAFTAGAGRHDDTSALLLQRI